MTPSPRSKQFPILNSPFLRGSCKTNPDDMEVVPPRAEIYPLRCFLEGRVPPRPFWAEFCKRLFILNSQFLILNFPLPSAS